MSDIREWLKALDLGEFAGPFETERVAVSDLPELSEADLIDLGLPLGPRRRVLKAVRELHDNNRKDGPDAQPARDDERPLAVESDALKGPREAERRQITVMFCDLVGSTALSEQLDPEDLRALMTAYQKSCGAAVNRYNGHVAQYLGDGLMIYFGWPRAHEDDAERAVRAGLEIIDAVKAVDAPEPLQVRIGIATGSVVVGETGAGDAAVPKAAVGETPNVAARVQALAGRDQILIAPSTQQLTGGVFDYDDLGEQTLKGIVEPVRVWRVLGESQAEGRFEAHTVGGLTPFVGREAEVSMLLDRWQRAREGEGQVVLLEGEPGIGKSRLAQVLRTRLSDDSHTRLGYQCSPYYSNSAFHPLVVQLERAAGFTHGDDPDTRLDKLEALLANATDTVMAVAPLVAAMLSLPIERYPPLNLSPQKQKDNTIAALADQVMGLARREPVLMIFEDAHWSDPTTLETLSTIISRIQDMPVLAVITYRPEFTPPWTGHGHITVHTLNRLGRKHGAAMIAKVTGGKALPEEVLEQIIGKTDGIPLFVEELTKTVLEAGLLTDHGDAYALAGPLPPFAIPATLKDSLIARLDRLAPVKEVAQLGACIGREFSHELLAAISSLSDNELEDALQELVNSELIWRRGAPPEATYTFKHALVQDAAYETLLKSNRQQIHATIGDVLETRFQNVSQAEPETLAQHFTRARLSQRALPYWLAAAKKARMRSANQEAISHLKSGLSLLGDLAANEERDKLELEFQATLAPLYFMAVGWGSSDGFVACQRAHALCVSTDDMAHLPYVLAGLAYSQRLRGQVSDSDRLIEQLFDAATSTNKDDHLLLAYLMRGLNYMYSGNWRGTLEHLEEALSHHVLPDQRELALECGFDPAVSALAFKGFMNWQLGYPDQAKKFVHESISLAEELAHPSTLAFAFTTPGADLSVLMRDIDAVEPYADRTVRICNEYRSFAQNRAEALIAKGWAKAYRKQFDDVLPQMTRALAEYKATGASAILANRLTAEVAEAYGMAGRADEGLEVLAKSPDRVRGQPVRFAEILRIEGELMLSKAEPDSVAAEKLFQEAIEIAREEGSICWELRSAICLVRLWLQQGKPNAAANLLTPIYARFEEGFDTTDLKEARLLLDALRAPTGSKEGDLTTAAKVRLNSYLSD